MSHEAVQLVLNHSGAAGTELLTLLAIAERADERMRAWPSIAEIGHRSRVTDRRSVRRNLTKLVTRGELEIRQNAGGSSYKRADQRPNLYLIRVAVDHHECTVECDRLARRRWEEAYGKGKERGDPTVPPSASSGISRGSSGDAPGTAQAPQREDPAVPPRGDLEDPPRGDQAVRNGGTPRSPEPSVEPPVSTVIVNHQVIRPRFAAGDDRPGPSLRSGDDDDEACRYGCDGLWISTPDGVRACPVHHPERHRLEERYRLEHEEAS